MHRRKKRPYCDSFYVSSQLWLFLIHCNCFCPNSRKAPLIFRLLLRQIWHSSAMYSISIELLIWQASCSDFFRLVRKCTKADCLYCESFCFCFCFQPSLCAKKTVSLASLLFCVNCNCICEFAYMSHLSLTSWALTPPMPHSWLSGWGLLSAC